MDSDPIIVKGNVSEKNISKLNTEAPAKVQLIGGTVLEGKINYISSIADPDTRTFTVEVAIDNPNNQIKVGTTAEISKGITPSRVTFTQEGDATNEQVVK